MSRQPLTSTQCTPRIVISDSPLRSYTLKEKGGTTQDIIDAILLADTMGDDFVLKGVDCLRGPDHRTTMQNVWNFIKGHVRYVADKRGHEVIKSPGALFKTGYGDCKSFTLAVNSILKRLGVPRAYRFAAYDNGDFTHVYAVANTPQGEILLDTVHTEFDDEVRYRHKKDYAVAGIGQAPTTDNRTKNSLAIALGLLITWSLLSK